MAKKFETVWYSDHSISKREDEFWIEFEKYDTFKEAKAACIEKTLNDIDALKFQLRNLRSLKEKDL